MSTDSPFRRRTVRAWAGSRGVSLGRIAGIPVAVSYSWLASVALITVLAAPVVLAVVPGATTMSATLISLLLAVLLGVSVLAHELGHCLAAKVCGIGVRRVRLYILGGVSELDRVPAAPGQEAVIAGAGPAASLLLAVLSALLIGTTAPHTLGWLLLIEIAIANAAIAAFNILPALPLDGGRVLRAGVWRLTGRRRTGTQAAVLGGYLIAALLAVFALVRFAAGGVPAVLMGAIALVMALFVVVGATGEQRAERVVHWPSGLSLAAVALPVVQLPAETPLLWARQTASGRAVLLTGTDGATVGLLDDALADSVQQQNPCAESRLAARPLNPEVLLLTDDDPDEVVARVQRAPHLTFVLIDPEGHPAGVVTAGEIARVLSGRPEPPAQGGHRE